ncbi:MAG: hypothetical protein QOJ42_4273 [Acidobacteriaceae bacterium]|jgi:hypothetical protein|nr:hypothetical protein [Acidobacteriaceae bacterium]
MRGRYDSGAPRSAALDASVPGAERSQREAPDPFATAFTVVPAAEVARCLIGAAQLGSLDAQKWILNRCAPARRGRVVVLDDFPEIGGPEDIAAALAATAAGVADGVISADEAALVANVLQKSWMCSKRRIAFVAACRWWMTAAGDRP